MARKAVADGYLVGAYGLFWDRYVVEWHPGSGPRAWQLLGRRNRRKPALSVCDFRQAHGVYALYDHYGPTYVGLARGNGGLGARLRSHDDAPPRGREWFRFCWMAFDDVVDDSKTGWERVKHRVRPAPTSAETTIREVEALLIAILGTQQNNMTFQSATRWEQLPPHEAEELARRGAVDPVGFTFRPELAEAW